MLMEFLSHLMSFDIAWIVNLVMGNLHWVFALFAFAFIAEKGKKSVRHFLVLVLFLYAFLDIMELGGWILVPLLLLMIIELALGLYFEEGTWPHKNFVKIVTVLIFVLSFVHTFYFPLPG